MTTTHAPITPDKLSAFMDFDHVIQVHADGTVSDDNDLYAPSLYDGVLDADEREGWSLMNGYSGQSGYSGPVMHNSEFIGGGMARDILKRPGYYVSLVCYWTRDEGDDADSDNIEGWGVAFKESYDLEDMS